MPYIKSPVGNLSTDYVFDTLGNLRKTTQGEQYRFFRYDSLGRLLYARQPEQDANSNFFGTGYADEITSNNQWSVKYTYDDNSNIATTTDAGNITITATYDHLNRLTLRDYSDSTMLDETFYYDGKGLGSVPNYSKGKMTRVSSSVSENRYTSFDTVGRTLTSQQITDGQTYNFGYSYNLSGGLIEETYPSGRVVKNTINQDGKLSQVQSKKDANSGFWTYANGFSYNAAGALDKMRLGNGHWETYLYNNRLQITQIGLGVVDSAQDLLKLEFGYNTTGNTNNNGSMLSQKITVPTIGGSSGFVATQTYTYDSLNRVQSAAETVSGSETWKQTFSYDRYGNRRFDTSNNNTTTLGSCPTAVCNPTINTSNNRFSSGQGYSYNASGALTQDAEGRRFGYDANGQQKEFFTATNGSSTPDATYYYDGEGRRVKKISSTETTIFVYDGGGQLAAEYSTAISTTPQVSYLTNDHLGSPRLITDQTGAVTKRQDYSAFGEETSSSQRTSGLKYTTSAQDNVRQDYTGYQKDDESGLEYAQARYYNPNHGRFTSIDPLTASATIRNPQTFNRYSYVLNSPYKFTDPLGLAPADMGVLQTTNGFEAREADRQSRKEFWEAMHAPSPTPPPPPPPPAGDGTVDASTITPTVTYNNNNFWTDNPDNITDVGEFSNELAAALTAIAQTAEQLKLASLQNAEIALNQSEAFVNELDNQDSFEFRDMWDCFASRNYGSTSPEGYVVLPNEVTSEGVGVNGTLAGGGLSRSGRTENAINFAVAAQNKANNQVAELERMKRADAAERTPLILKFTARPLLLRNIQNPNATRNHVMLENDLNTLYDNAISRGVDAAIERHKQKK